jgi:hypothetical protein
MALLMVRAGARGSVAVRPVQDFGRTDDPAPVELGATVLTVAPAPKRDRGRPPGSRNKKNGGLAPTALN